MNPLLQMYSIYNPLNVILTSDKKKRISLIPNLFWFKFRCQVLMSTIEEKKNEGWRDEIKDFVINMSFISLDDMTNDAKERLCFTSLPVSLLSYISTSPFQLPFPAFPSLILLASFITLCRVSPTWFRRGEHEGIRSRFPTRKSSMSFTSLCGF